MVDKETTNAGTASGQVEGKQTSISFTSVPGYIFSRSNKETWVTVMSLILFYALAVVFYMPVEDFSFGDCIYFATVMVSTVGYGDFLPSSDGSKIFTVIYVHMALVIIAVAIDNLNTALLQKWVHDQALREVQDIGVFDAKAQQRRRRRQFGIATGCYIFLMLIGTVVFATAQDWDEEEEGNKWVNGLYLTAITLTTVGFGDYSPTEDGTKFFGCLMMIFGVPLTATSLAFFSELVFGESWDAIELHHVKGLTQKKLTSLEEFCTELTRVGARNAADTSKVSKIEFMCFLLVRNNVVGMDEIEGMMSNFDELDRSNSGFITMEDVQRSSIGPQLASNNSVSL